MILDWLIREGWVLLSWWGLVSLAGLAVLPLCWSLLRGLPDRGYTLARTLGLLLIGSLFWLLASLGFVGNSTGGMMIAWLLILGIGILLYQQQANAISLREYWQSHKRMIVLSEILFAGLFLLWTLFRAYQNDTFTTEKPMELAFISGIMRSEAFPPADPWMAGYSISYYYLGYVIAAILAKLSGVTSTVAFSMTTALLFSLSGLSAFGVVYNMAMSRQAGSMQRHGAAIAAGLLATFCVIFMGNFQLPLIEIPYQSRSMPESYFDFWGTQARSNFGGSYTQLHSSPTITNPEDWGYWWFFRASRVLTDYNLDGSLPPDWFAQPISEFPAFSFILADNHPHVLALPFVLMTLGLCLNLLLAPQSPGRKETLLYGIVIGGLIFLNTWDGPIYLAIFVGANALRRLIHRGELQARDWLELITFGLFLLLIAGIVYSPFFISFRSQAAGILPNPIFATNPAHFFLMLGPLLLLVLPYLLYAMRSAWRESRFNVVLSINVAVILTAVLSLMMIMLLLLGMSSELFRGITQNFIDESGGWSAAFPQFIQRRIEYAPTGLVLLLMIGGVVGILFRKRPLSDASEEVTVKSSVSHSTGFALLMIGAAATLAFVPEFVYLRDNFGTRINTVFKFYYQVWVLLSLAAAYGAYELLVHQGTGRRSLWQAAYAVLLLALLGLGSLYPVLGFHYRTQVETGRYRIDNPVDLPTLTLDGGPRMISPDEYANVRCLERLIGRDQAIVVEAVGGAYNPNYGRVGTLTGIPILLGWPNHERQWRGATYASIAGSREVDIQRLYQASFWQDAAAVLERYSVDYVVLGQTERQQYGYINEDLFFQYLDLVCESGTSRIFRVPAIVNQS